MAFTLNELHGLDMRIRQLRRDMRYYQEYSEPWTRAKLEMQELKEEKAKNLILPQPGDLLVDHEYPETGVALVLELGDRRRSKDNYKLLHEGKAMWYDKDYIEYQCRFVNRAPHAG